jgi:hypothetical protein
MEKKKKPIEIKLEIKLFQPFKNINEGFNELFERIQAIRNTDDRIELTVIYGCLCQTYNDNLKENTL